MDRILIVDDDLELTGMLSEYLATEGFDTRVSLAGSEGAEQAIHGGTPSLFSTSCYRT